MAVEGTISTEGSQSLSGMPFRATLSDDTLDLVMSGPFGITAARIHAEPDTFMAANYLLREAHDGSPTSPDLTRSMPVPLTIADLRLLMRGRVPGDVSRFSFVEDRPDGTLLFVSRDSTTAEYVLVDTVTNVLRQYQRKKIGAGVVINITMSDVRETHGVYIPYAIDVTFDDKKETARFRYTSVVFQDKATALPRFAIPPSFKRTTYR